MKPAWESHHGLCFLPTGRLHQAISLQYRVLSSRQRLPRSNSGSLTPDPLTPVPFPQSIAPESAHSSTFWCWQRRATIGDEYQVYFPGCNIPVGYRDEQHSHEFDQASGIHQGY